MRTWLIALGIGMAAGSACLVELEHVLACGDGYVDELAGEECDPNVPDSYKGACTNRPYGRGGCDPDSCEIINSEQQCAHCGDGLIDPAAGEECDGSTVGVPCLGGGQPTCTLDCKISMESCDQCGDGEPDPGEECDPRTDGDDLVFARACAGNDDEDALPSPHTSKPYTSGTAVTCLDDCKFDRRSCGYCGDGKRDDPFPVSVSGDMLLSFPEVCDGDDIDPAVLASNPVCTQLGAQANVACNDDCLDATQRDLQTPCCLGPNTPCPADGDALRCCFEYAHPEIAESCLPVIRDGDGDADGDGPMLCR
jgi:hypothetical protein